MRRNLPAIHRGTCHIDRRGAALGGVFFFGPRRILQVKGDLGALALSERPSREVRQSGNPAFRTDRSVSRNSGEGARYVPLHAHTD